MARSKLPWILDLVSPYLTEWSYRAEVVRVVEGDTLELRLDLGFKTYRIIQVRLIGLDTPDGKLANTFAFSWVRQQRGEILIRSEKDGSGKYGQWLAEVWSRDQSKCLNADLITEGLATPWGK